MKGRWYHPLGFPLDHYFAINSNRSICGKTTKCQIDKPKEFTAFGLENGLVCKLCYKKASKLQVKEGG